MALSTTGQKIVAHVDQIVTNIESKISELEPKVRSRRTKAENRLDRAEHAKDDGLHILTGLRDKYLKLLKPKNAKTMETLKRLDKAVEQGRTFALVYREHVQSVTTLLSNNPNGDKELEMRHLKDDATKANAAVSELDRVDTKYKMAKAEEKKVFDAMKTYMDEKSEKQEEGKKAYKDWKKEMAEKIKELAGD
jgi:hypothetical protein